MSGGTEVAVYSASTPAAARLAEHGPTHQAAIDEYIATRLQYWDSAFNREQLLDAIEALGITGSGFKSATKSQLVALLVEWDRKHDNDRPDAFEALAALERLARDERHVLDQISAWQLDEVDEQYKRTVSAGLARDGMSPGYLVDLAEAWQERREQALTWGFVASRIRAGLEPLEAAREAHGHFLAQVVSFARYNGQGEQSRAKEMMRARQAGAYARFLDSVGILDSVAGDSAR